MPGWKQEVNAWMESANSIYHQIAPSWYSKNYTFLSQEVFVLAVLDFAQHFGSPPELDKSRTGWHF